MQDSFGKPEIKKCCHHPSCDFSFASVTLPCTQRPRPNSYVTGIYYFWLIFTVHFVTGSKGNDDIIRCEKNVSRSAICPKSEKKGKYFTSLSRHFYFVSNGV